MEKKVNLKGQGQIFENPFLERLTKTSRPQAFLVYGTYITAGIVYSAMNGYTTLLGGILLFFLGLLSWSLGEYLLHRYLFHWIDDSEFGKKFHHAIHGIHHDYPNDTNRLFMPSVPGTIISATLLGLFYLMLGVNAFIFTSGFILGYLMYANIHYSTHTIRKPIKFLRPLWHHHHLHHYKYPEKAYGVSSPLWDYIFRTMPPVEDRYGAKRQ